MKVEVVADGTVHGTRVVDQSSKNTLEAKAVSFSHEAGKTPRVTVEVLMAPARIVGLADFVAVDPLTGLKKKILRIDYADGTSFEP